MKAIRSTGHPTHGFRAHLQYDRWYETVTERMIIGPQYRATAVGNFPFVGI